MAQSRDRWMRLALSLAARGLGNVWPNPAVGCVIIRDGRLVGRGWTQPSGRPHAETMALAQAGENARGATAYVTLEPCSHHGKTPPCADALIAAGISKVICALEDPDPRVSGRGFERLKNAGLDVITDVLALEAEALNLGYLLNRTIERPMVTLKLALSLDGRIATKTGESRWITGPAARRKTHMLRANHDAVLIGRGTAAADNPMLNIRDMGLENANPVRIVADGGLSLSPSSRLARSARDIPLWLCHHPGIERARRDMWHEIGAKLIEVQTTTTGELNITDLLGKLAQNGLTRVLCEGGGQLAASLLQSELVDQLITYHAGLVLGANARAGIGALPFETLPEFPRFEMQSVTLLAPDLETIWKPA